MKLNYSPNFVAFKTSLKKSAFRTPVGKLIFYKIRVVREKISLARYSDFEYIATTYEQRFGREINLSSPQTYTEKLQWLKLFYRHPDMPKCSDKFEVRDYLSERGYAGLLNELVGVYDNANQIDFASLPQKFVAKASHGSGWNLICKDKASLDWKSSKRIMNAWLKLNLYVFGREWNYRDQVPRIVVEKFLEQDPLIDYKFMCFNGQPKYIQINNDKDGVHYVDFYDTAWTKLDVTYEQYKASEHYLEKPPLFDKMIQLAQELSAPFPFARIDFYNPDDATILFGEITFFPGGGLLPLVPVEKNVDAMFGSSLRLPEPNFNLQLYRDLRKRQPS